MVNPPGVFHSARGSELIVLVDWHGAMQVEAHSSLNASKVSPANEASKSPLFPNPLSNQDDTSNTDQNYQQYGELSHIASPHHLLHLNSLPLLQSQVAENIQVTNQRYAMSSHLY